jgi:hypothetical protein
MQYALFVYCDRFCARCSGASELDPEQEPSQPVCAASTSTPIIGEKTVSPQHKGGRGDGGVAEPKARVVPSSAVAAGAGARGNGGGDGMQAQEVPSSAVAAGARLRAKLARQCAANGEKPALRARWNLSKNGCIDFACGKVYKVAGGTRAIAQYQNQNTCSQDALAAGVNALGMAVNKAALYSSTLPHIGDTHVTCILQYATNVLGVDMRPQLPLSPQCGEDKHHTTHSLLQLKAGVYLVELTASHLSNPLRRFNHVVVYDANYKTRSEPGAHGAIVDNRTEMSMKLVTQSNRDSVEQSQEVFHSALALSSKWRVEVRSVWAISKKEDGGKDTAMKTAASHKRGVRGKSGEGGQEAGKRTQPKMFIINQILDTRTEEGKVQYLVSWEGYDKEKDITW